MPYSSTSSAEANLLKPKSLPLEGERLSRVERESPGSPPESGSSNSSTGRPRRLGRQPAAMMGPDTKILVVWLEMFQDKDNFPTGPSTPQPACLFLSVHLSLGLSVSWPACLICPFMYLPVHSSICLCLSIHPSACLPVVSACLFLFARLSLGLSVFFPACLPVSVSACPLIHLPVFDLSVQRLWWGDIRSWKVKMLCFLHCLVVWNKKRQDLNNTSSQALETFLSPADLLSVTSTGQETVGTSSSSSMQKAGEKDVHYIIFIHALQNGLFRIHIQEHEKTQTK